MLSSRAQRGTFPAAPKVHGLRPRDDRVRPGRLGWSQQTYVWEDIFMRIERRTFNKLALAGAATGFAGGTASAQAKPLTIGFGMALTGGLAPNGKAALLAMQIAAEDINARVSIIGQPVKLGYYYERAHPSTVSGLYTKRLD